MSEIFRKQAPISTNNMDSIFKWTKLMEYLNTDNRLKFKKNIN